MPVINVNGIDTYFESRGTGKTVVFIHPPVLPSEIFRLQINELSRYYRVLVLDIRGHGHSSSGLVAWDFSDIANDIKVLLDTLKIERIWLCGYSAGASIAFEFAYMFPDYVEGMIQIGAVFHVGDRLLKGIVKAGIKTAESHHIPLLAFLGAIINTDSFFLFWSLRKAGRLTNGADAACYYRSYYRYTCRNKIEHIYKPVLLVYGQKDSVFGKYAKQICNALPHAKLTYIKKARHEIPGNYSEELNRLIRKFIP